MNVVLVILMLLQSPAGKAFRDYPVCAAFENTGKDTIQSALSLSNKLYVGIDNTLNVNKACLLKPNCITSDNGEAFEDEGSFLVIPSETGFATLKFFQCTKSDSVFLFEKTFEVKSLPKPRILIGDYILNELPFITKTQLSKEGKLGIIVDDDVIGSEKMFRIVDVVIGYSFGKMFVTKRNEGHTFSTEVLDIFMKQPPGREIMFLVHVEGEGGVIKTLPAIRIKIY